MSLFALEMQDLYTFGLDVQCGRGNRDVNVKVILCNVVGDNLGLQTIFGMRGISSNVFCRFCFATKQTRQLFFRESQFELRRACDYEDDCRYIVTFIFLIYRFRN